MYDLTTAATSRVVSLEGRNIDTYQIVDMRTSGNAFHLFGYSTDMNAASTLPIQRKRETSLLAGRKAHYWIQKNMTLMDAVIYICMTFRGTGPRTAPIPSTLSMNRVTAIR